MQPLPADLYLPHVSQSPQGQGGAELLLAARVLQGVEAALGEDALRLHHDVVYSLAHFLLELREDEVELLRADQDHAPSGRIVQAYTPARIPAVPREGHGAPAGGAPLQFDVALAAVVGIVAHPAFELLRVG